MGSRCRRTCLALGLGFILFASDASANTVAAGGDHTAVATPDGGVWTWGSNSWGQLGNGSTTPHSVPEQIPSLTGITAVAAGASHTLALKSDGTVWAFGANGSGQLGDGTQTWRSSPVAVVGLADVVAIAAGDSHSVALTSDGRIWTWGANSNGQLGDGTTTLAKQPLLVSNTITAIAIAAGGNHTLIVKNDNTVWAWGANANGQLGDASTTQRPLPVQMGTVANATSVAAGSAHSLVLRSDGTVVSVGRNSHGQLGDNSQTQRTTPVVVGGLSGVTAITAGQDFSMALLSDGTLRGWGSNTYGELGDTTSNNFRTSPVSVASVTGIALLEAGASFSIAVTSDGVVWTWGLNSSGQLGNGTTQNRSTPGAISGTSYDWKVGTPALNVASGTYSTERTVTITVATAGAQIHYTLTGADPTESDPTISSGGTVQIDQTRTLKAKAWKAGMPASDIGSATYTLAAAAPSFSPFPTTYTSAQNVTITSSSPGVTIRYTTDGSSPTSSSTAYTAPLSVSTTTTLKAAAFRSGWTTSNTATGAYTMNFGTLSAPTISPTETTHTSEVLVTMSAMAGATIRYTTDGSTPQPSSPIYSDAITVTTTKAITARAFHPDYTTSASAARTYTIVVATPTLTPTAGTYTAGQTITVSTTTVGATIRYTLNGAEPTTSDPVITSGATLVVGNYMLKVKAWKTGCTTSATASATYDVTGSMHTGRLAGGGAHSLALRTDGVGWSWGKNLEGQLGNGTVTQQLLPGIVSGLTGAVSIAAGTAHSLAVRADGTVVAWGDNSAGQVGDGGSTLSDRVLAVTVAGLSATSVAAGTYHSLAIHADGTLWAWGQNTGGKLGDGTTQQRTTPVQVSGLSQVTTADGGNTFSLARRSDNSVWSWGSNANGELGDPGTTGRTVPGAVPGITTATSVAAGDYFALALLADGTVRSWGYNAQGRLGDGSTTQRDSPVIVSGLANVVAISAGNGHSLALTGEGEVWAWGLNFNGQVGDGTNTDRTTPVRVLGLPFIQAIAAGAQHSLALGADGSVWAWGNNADGRLGDGTTTSRNIPVQIADAAMAWKVAAPTLSIGSGLYYSALSVIVSGTDASATLHYTTDGASPTTANAVVASGGSVSVPVSLTLKVRAWKPGAVASEVTSATYELKASTPTFSPATGAYAGPQSVGIMTSTPGATLTFTTDASEPTASSPAYSSPIAVGDTRTVRARAYKTGWTPSDSGAASYWISAGIVATPSISPVSGIYPAMTLVTIACPTSEATIRFTMDGTEPTATSAVYRYPFAVRGTTTVKARAFLAGFDGSATATVSLTVDPADQTARPAISPRGGWFTTAQTVTVTASPGSVVRYTLNGIDPSPTDPEVPPGGIVVDRSQLLKVRAWQTGEQPSGVERADFVITGAVAAGWWHSLALTAAGDVYAWGHGNSGQLGNNTTDWTVSTPVQVLSDTVAIAAGATHSLALKRDGSLWGWGNNTYGQRGTGNTWSSFVPVQAAGLTNIVAIAAGAYHGLALRADGTLWSWGQNANGEVGDGSTTQRNTPVQVIGLRNVRSMAAGNGFSLAVTDEGADGGVVWAWGANVVGQLGDASGVARSIPVRVAGLDHVREVAAGEDFAIARLADGNLRTWGSNTYGQLASGTVVQSSAPIGVPQTGFFRRVSAGRWHDGGVDVDGRLWGWGKNESRQLGVERDTDPRVSLAPELATAVPDALVTAGGHSSTLVVRVDGTVWYVGAPWSASASIGSAVGGLSIGDQSTLIADQDGDGLPTWRELARGTDPLNADTNGNGLTDLVELADVFSGASEDTDGDGVASAIELARGTDPFIADTDEDGVPDGSDAFPLDPSRSTAPAPTPGDTTPPTITLTEPTTARPRPPLE